MKKILIICLVILGNNLYSMIPLTECEIEGIVLVREERKLASDLFSELYDTWDFEIFKLISQSEQTYMDEIKELIDKFNIEDPVKDNSRGIFTSPYIKKLYSNLVEKGNKSAYESVRIAATLEDLSIKDLNDLLELSTKKEIITLYNSLRMASIGYIRAISKELKKYDRRYQAQFLSNEELRAILLN